MAVKAEDETRTRRYHHGDLRSELLRAALENLDRYAPKTLSLKGLAQTIGVAQSAPYRHFTNRDALLIELATKGFVDLRKVIEEATGGQHGSAFSRCCNAYLNFSEKHQGLYRLMFDTDLIACNEEVAGTQLREEAAKAFDAWLQVVSRTTSPSEAKTICLWTWTTLHGLATTRQAKLPLAPQVAGLSSRNIIDIMERHLTQ